MDGFTLLRLFSGFFAAIITVTYLYQMLYLFLPALLKPGTLQAGPPGRYGVLIAARNEERVIAHLIRSLLAQNYPPELLRIYVVADNCTDGTAAVARTAGATVYTRQDADHTGKGYALNWLIHQISREPEGLNAFDAFLIFDADNLLAPDFIARIDRLRHSGYEAFCGCRNSKNFGDNWLSAAHSLQFLHESAHLNRSRMLLGSCCTVSGTGFGFTRQLLLRMGGWNCFTLSEDTEFTVRCMTQGIRIGYCHDAVFYDEQPTRFRQSWRQRTRWSQGTVQVSFRYLGQLLRGVFRGGITGYACFEMLTLSFWGYGAAGFSALLSLLVTFWELRWLGLAQAFLSALVSTWLSLFFIGLLTLLAEGSRIHATKGQKRMALFAFPIYMLSFVPIILTSLFRKFHWPPIEHSAAVPQLPPHFPENQ